ncbi:anthranilate synthase component I family protein [Microbacterium suwonense]|uniref:Chorismate-utilising enzyme C-terminal domain-containing protein n=1 Tax=Microbacterium suwonense TaxID=683047 RepID=A0ABM8FQS3_9MICO|nr:anthranilate synthase component I family protein [Microbacterium suwonense]BDZ38026.1 hypothetical protein GCM10025863_06400 [Microbacterium suwonense]
MPVPRPLDALALDDPAPGVVDVESLFLRLLSDAEACFWLDAGADAAAGWSIIGTGRTETDPDTVRAVRLTGHSAAADDETDVPFRGGWVGWLDYEQGAAVLGAPTVPPGGGGRAAWIAVTHAVAVDHGTGRVVVLADARELREWHAKVRDAIRSGPVSDPPPAPAARHPASARHSVAAYIDLVEECRAAIERGDAYQLCLTTRFAVPSPADPIAVYRHLRRATPAHHGGLIRVGRRYLLSASPEQFLRAEGGTASTSPIKGTRPRGATAEDDARLAEELRTDAKERAENVMIVDLMRNDLSHAGVPGTVRVPRLWEVETYPAVHQLVSTVTVQLRDGTRVGDLIDATFPAGSMTGAPKLSAMTILNRLEQAPRGVYSGCFGHIGLDGRIDLAMVIRSIVIDAEEAYVGAGGGITWLSRANAEAAEVAVKARAPLAALGATVPAEWAAVDQSR